MTLDNGVTLTVTGLKMEDERWITDKTYIHEGKLCKALNAILSLSSPDVLLEISCPVTAGTYYLENFAAYAFGVLFRNEMLGFKKLQVKLKHQNAIVGCYIVNAIAY